MSIRIEDLPPEIWSLISEFSSNPQNALISKVFYDIAKYEEEKALKDPHKYIDALHPFIKYLLPNYRFQKKIYENVCQKGRKDLLILFPEEFIMENKNEGLEYAAKGGHLELVKYFERKGAIIGLWQLLSLLEKVICI